MTPDRAIAAVKRRIDPSKVGASDAYRATYCPARIGPNPLVYANRG